jgi:hypothetical protein
MAGDARVREKDAVDLVRGNGGADGTGAAGYYGLGVDSGDKMPKSGEEQVVEICLCEGEEDGAAKGVADGVEGHADCEFGLGKGALHCHDGLQGVSKVCFGVLRLVLTTGFPRPQPTPASIW